MRERFRLPTVGPLGAGPRKEPRSLSQPTYSPEFKRKAVEEHLKEGNSVAAICREYHVGKWRFGGGGPSTRRRTSQRRARRRWRGS